MKNSKIKVAAEKYATMFKKGEIGYEEYHKQLLKLPEVKFKETPPQLPVINENK